MNATGTELSYQLWDVFTRRALAGNALAVIPEAEGLSEAQMQALAREFNLSETSFVLRPAQAEARARYFTPARELPFAGHPSVGTAFALRRLGRVGAAFGLELPAGVVPMRFEAGPDGAELAWMDQGVPELVAEVEDRLAVARALGLDVEDLVDTLPLQVVSAGVPFLLVPLDSLEVLGRARLQAELLGGVTDPAHRSVLAFTLDAPESDVRARMFGEAVGVREDPATGSAHGPLGWYLHRHELFALSEGERGLISHQGVEMGRPSELHLRLRRASGGVAVEVGGGAVLVGEGTLYL